MLCALCSGEAQPALLHLCLIWQAAGDPRSPPKPFIWTFRYAIWTSTGGLLGLTEGSKCLTVLARAPLQLPAVAVLLVK